MVQQGIIKRFIENNTITVPNEELNINKILNIGANIISTLDNTFSIGSTDKKWKSIYIGDAIYIGNTLISANQQGVLNTPSISFTNKINEITSNELHALSGINKNIQQQINELNLDNIINGNSNKYIINGLYNGSMTISSNLNIGTHHSTQNPNGNLHVFGNLILEGDITTFNPLITQVHRHLSNYNFGYIDIYNIDDSSNKPSIKIKHNNGYSNIFECYSKNDIELNNSVFIISSNGNIGINNNQPVEKLDIIGNIKYTGKINNITAEELDNLSGIDYNIKQKIYNNDINQLNNELNQSNYVKQTSNILNARQAIALKNQIARQHREDVQHARFMKKLYTWTWWISGFIGMLLFIFIILMFVAQDRMKKYPQLGYDLFPKTEKQRREEALPKKYIGR
jgi:hypothetical protein